MSNLRWRLVYDKYGVYVERILQEYDAECGTWADIPVVEVNEEELDEEIDG